jgi:methylmalonyl-CoA mutase C-terminal domain/subunit
MSPRPPRVVLSKVGLDGHDRGVKVVARALRDAGMEVIYTGLWQTPDRVIRAVADEDADVLGISILSGAHMTLVPILIDLLKKEGLSDVLLVVGGIIPDEDVPKLLEMGVGSVFIPGSSLDSIVEFIHSRVPAKLSGK